MRIWNALSIVALLVAVANSTWIYGQQKKKLPAMLSPEDYLEIQQLYSYYTRDVDGGSVRNACWSYTPDGIFDTGRKVQGTKDLCDTYGRIRIDQAQGMRHFSTNPVLVPTEEGARGSLLMVGIDRQGKDDPITLNTFGKYEDRLVKTPAGWRFKERIWRQDSFRHSGVPVLSAPFSHGPNAPYYGSIEVKDPTNPPLGR